MRLIAAGVCFVVLIGTATPVDASSLNAQHAGVDVGEGRTDTANVTAVGNYDEDGSSGGGTGTRKPTIKHGTGKAVNADAAPVCIDYVTPDHPYYGNDDCWVIPLEPGQPIPNQPPPGQQDPAVAAQHYALDYVRSITLPSPKPEISAPRGGICGVVHSLDLHIDDPSPSYIDPDTPFGPLAVTFRGRFSVNWGDGTKVDTYTTTGAPYPDSNITHSWTTRGFYNIGVTADWTASWSFGQYSGTVTGFRTTGAINQFRVWEIQAIVTE